MTLGPAWAFGGHAIVSEHGAAGGLSAHHMHDTNDTHDDANSADCDHCCHIGFHLLGVLCDNAAAAHSGSHPFLSCSAYRWTSTPRLPPLRPPRS